MLVSLLVYLDVFYPIHHSASFRCLPFFFAFSTRSLSLSPAEFAIVKSTFSNTAKENIMAGLSLFFLPRTSLVVSVLFYIHPRYTHTPLYFIKSSMLRKYLKNESIGRWLPDVHHYTHFSKLN